MKTNGKHVAKKNTNHKFGKTFALLVMLMVLACLFMGAGFVDTIEEAEETIVMEESGEDVAAMIIDEDTGLSVEVSDGFEVAVEEAETLYGYQGPDGTEGVPSSEVGVYTRTFIDIVREADDLNATIDYLVLNPDVYRSITVLDADGNILRNYQYLKGGNYYKWTNRMIRVHEIADMARELGLPESDPIIKRCQELWNQDNNDMKIIAKTISKEAGSCPEWHRIAVGAVVINRVNDPRFPDTVYAVITQPKQYSSSYAYGFDGVAEQYYLDAIKAMNGEHDVPSNVVWQAEFFQGKGIWKTSYVDTGWWRSTTYFCY